MTWKPPDEDFYIDAEGCLVERTTIGGINVVMHYRDIPECDITSVDGIPVTTPLRTVIDLAPQLTRDDLRLMVRDCLDRGLFTPEDARKRLAEPDMVGGVGANLLRQFLDDPSERI